MDLSNNSIALIIIGVVLVFYLSRIIKYKSIKGALLGCRIESTTADVYLTKCTMNKVLIVHVVFDGEERGVVLNYSESSPVSLSMLPILLSKEKAEEFNKILALAIEQI